MARCGCQTPTGVCNCAVIGGANVTVTGTGGADTPYVISVADPAASRGYLEVTDSDSVDHTLGGTGTFADPYELSSLVRINPDETNLLQSTEDGLAVLCSSIISCLGAESPGEGGILDFGCGFEGIGTPGDPISLLPGVRFRAQNEVFSGPNDLAGGVTSWALRDITNPSDCADAIVIAVGRVTSRFQPSLANHYELAFEFGPTGDTIQAPFYGNRTPSTGSAVTGVASGMSRFRTLTLAPSASVEFRGRCHGIDGAVGDTFSDTNIGIYVLCIVNPAG